MKDFKALFRGNKFFNLWISQLLSQITIHIMNFVIIVKLLTETGSTIATSMLWISYALPAIIFGPVAAASVDIFDKRRVLMITNLFQSLLILAYAIFSRQSTFSLYGLVIAYSFFNQFYVPAEQASLPTIVKKKNLAQANGLFFMTQQVSIVVGFGVAGFLNQLLGFYNTLFLGSLLIFLAFVSVSFLPSMRLKKEAIGHIDESVINFFKSIVEGYRFIKGSRKVFLPLLILLGMHVTLPIVFVNVPVVVKDLLGVSVNLAGLVAIVPAGIGAGIGALFVPRILKRGVRKKRVIENSLRALLVSLIVLNFLIPILLGPIKFVVSSIFITLTGFSFVGILLAAQTFLQEVTPEEYRGRVFGNFWFLATVITVFPMIFSGAVAEYFGIRTLVFVITLFVLYLYVFSKAKGDKLLAKVNND